MTEILKEMNLARRRLVNETVSLHEGEAYREDYLRWLYGSGQVRQLLRDVVAGLTRSEALENMGEDTEAIRLEKAFLEGDAETMNSILRKEVNI
jgi:hypothetical protein